MKVFITGGAGFIGCNLAKFYLDRGDAVIVLDNLSRKGAKKNLEWLQTQGDFDFVKRDIRDFSGLKDTFNKCGKIDVLYHLAAQVAVTTSVADPREDFEINALGTFNVLEAVRESGVRPVVIYSSTNKVYGEMTDVGVEEISGRYQYRGLPAGVPETRSLDFHSPYGCSKGCADQYAVDYSRIYGLRTVCLRQSCIYGPRQFGVEDQGWVAWFTIAAALGKPVTIYGDGKQVRDILHVQDLVEAFHAAYEKIDSVSGMAINIGGGPGNQMSLLELVEILEGKTGRKLDPAFDEWRPGDQKVYVSNIEKAREHLGWEPRISKDKGVDALWDWVNSNRELFKDF
jgi:CDP-paratose 2-epimerase